MNYGGLWNDHFDTPAQINQSFCFLFCAVGTWSTTSQFLPSIWILDGAGRSVDVDCCVPCSNALACQREHSVPDALPLRLWQHLPVSDGEPMLLMTEMKNEISMSTDGAVCLCVYWLAIRERRFSTKSGSMWKILARTGMAPLSSIGANFLQLSP